MRFRIRRTQAHMQTHFNGASRELIWCLCQRSYSQVIDRSDYGEWRLKLSDFDRTIEGNLTFHFRMHEVTASWESILYSTSMPASASPMMGWMDCTLLGLVHKMQEYNCYQSTNFHFRNNSTDSQSICPVYALSSLHHTHTMSWSSHHSCLL